MSGAKNANVWERTSILIKASRLSTDHKCRESLLFIEWRKFSFKGVNHRLNTHVIKNVILKPAFKHSNTDRKTNETYCITIINDGPHLSERSQQTRKKERDCRLTPASITLSKSGLEFRIQSPEGDMHQTARHRQQDQPPTCVGEVLVDHIISFFPSWLSSNCTCDWIQVLCDIGWIWIRISCQDIINLYEIWFYTISVVFSKNSTYIPVSC